MVTSLLLFSIFVEGPVYKTSRIDITPPEPLPLGGYTSRGEAVFEPGGERLYARTFLFEDSDLQVALVSVEMLTIPESLVKAVKAHVAPKVKVMLVATHTHSAPDSQMLNERMTFKVPGIATVKRRWLDWYAERIATGINDAIASEGTDARTLVLAKAEVDTNHGRREGAVPDKTAIWLTASGKPLITLYSAHATVLEADNALTSGDWPGRTAAAMGGLVLPGAIGDVAPNLVGANDVEKLQNIVEKLSSGLAAAQVWDLSYAARGYAFVTEAISLDKPVPHPEFAKTFGAGKPFDQVLIDKFAPIEATVTLFRLGDLLIVGIPGEPTSEIGRKVQVLGQEQGFPHTVAVSHCNGWIGYVLEPEDYDRGGYEATLAFHGRETATKVIEAVKRAMIRMAQPAALRREVHVR